MLRGLRPALTRAGFDSGGRLRVETHAPSPEDYIRVEGTDLWLLPAVIAEKDRRAGEEKLKAIAERQKAHEMKGYAAASTRGARILGRTAITETGCMVDGLRGAQNPFSVARDFAEREWGSFAFTTEEEMPHVQVCNTPGCYNSRHYDMDFGRLTLKERTVEANPNFYKTLPNGKIQTIWGDVLPSIEESLEYFIWMQRQNFPFVPNSESRLTPTSVSQIKFHPVAGCWEAWQYYCRSETNHENWQYDGYGRLYQKKITKQNKVSKKVRVVQKAGHKVSHRVTWLAMGHTFKRDQVLNHLCSYRRCCNPLHMRQESKTANSYHGVRVQAAINQLYATNPEAKDASLSVIELLKHGRDIRKLYEEIWQEMEKDAAVAAP